MKEFMLNIHGIITIMWLFMRAAYYPAYYGGYPYYYYTPQYYYYEGDPALNVNVRIGG